MDKVSVIDKFVCPFGGQEVELQHVEYEAGGIPVLRLRIREKKRFTIFDMDPVSAARWGEAMLGWAKAQPSESAAGND